MDSHTLPNPSVTRATGDRGMAPQGDDTVRLDASNPGSGPRGAPDGTPGPGAKGGWGSGYDLQEGYAPQGPKADTEATAQPSAPKR